MRNAIACLTGLITAAIGKVSMRSGNFGTRSGWQGTLFHRVTLSWPRGRPGRITCAVSVGRDLGPRRRFASGIARGR
jgi:hypothetical protein